MAETILEHGLLKTTIEECDMCIRTAVEDRARTPHSGRAWTTVLAGRGLCAAVVWAHVYAEPTTPGGLEEAHNSIVAQVRAGTLPRPRVPDDEVDT